MDARWGAGNEVVLGGSVQGCFNPCQSLLRQWVNSEKIVPSGRNLFREDEAHIASGLKREEVEPITLSCQEAAQPNVEAFLVPFDGPTNSRVDHEGRLPALTDLFNCIETQHCRTPSLKGQAAYEGSTPLLRIRFSLSLASPEGRPCLGKGLGLSPRVSTPMRRVLIVLLGADECPQFQNEEAHP